MEVVAPQGVPVLEQACKNTDDVLWKEAGCTTELDYAEQTSWLLFLKYLDGLEQDFADQAAPEGRAYIYILDDAPAGIATARESAERNLRNARAVFESYLDAVRGGRKDTSTRQWTRPAPSRTG